jgi:predicted transposase/invertase (TIGR01784 family)
MKKGIIIGEERGIIKGRQEEKEQTVVKSFKNGASIDLISSITDLSKEEIVSILQKHELI